jgi:hypothetical protein
MTGLEKERGNGTEVRGRKRLIMKSKKKDNMGKTMGRIKKEGR